MNFHVEAWRVKGYWLYMKKVYWIILIILLFCFSSPFPVRAHPHIWIDMNTKLIFNNNGHIQALEIFWLFDPFYSAFLSIRVEQIRKKGKKNAYSEFASGMAERLAKHHYFTEATVNGKRIQFFQHRNTASGKISRGKNKGRFWSKLTLDLSQPIDPKKNQFSYSVYDPTYYIEILHVEKQPAFELVGLKNDNCIGRLIKANPDEEIRTFAASLDKTQSGGKELGRLFADRVVLQCK